MATFCETLLKLGAGIDTGHRGVNSHRGICAVRKTEVTEQIISK